MSFKIKIDGQNIDSLSSSKNHYNKVKFSTKIDKEILNQLKLFCKYKNLYLNNALETLILYLQDEEFLKDFLNKAKARQSDSYNPRNLDVNSAFEKYKKDLKKGEW